MEMFREFECHLKILWIKPVSLKARELIGQLYDLVILSRRRPTDRGSFTAAHASNRTQYATQIAFRATSSQDNGKIPCAAPGSLKGLAKVESGDLWTINLVRKTGLRRIGLR